MNKAKYTRRDGVGFASKTFAPTASTTSNGLEAVKPVKLDCDLSFVQSLRIIALDIGVRPLMADRIS